MKTVSEVAAFLKRNPGKAIYISYDERLKRFEVTYDRTTSDSKYLDDALENLSETLRRRDSGLTLKDAISINVTVSATCGDCNDSGITKVPFGSKMIECFCQCAIGDKMFRGSCGLP